MNHWDTSTWGVEVRLDSKHLLLPPLQLATLANGCKSQFHMPPRMVLYYIPASRPRGFVIMPQRKIEKPVRCKKREKYHHDLFSRAHFLLK